MGPIQPLEDKLPEQLRCQAERAEVTDRLIMTRFIQVDRDNFVPSWMIM